MLSQLLQSPEVTALLTSVVLGVLYTLLGKAGKALEQIGVDRDLLALVVIGKRLEALGYDGDKLSGKPGANEAAFSASKGES